eukprot:1173799-Prorocentrum_minimum.AAC.1
MHSVLRRLVTHGRDLPSNDPERITPEGRTADAAASQSSLTLRPTLFEETVRDSVPTTPSSRPPSAWTSRARPRGIYRERGPIVWPSVLSPKL